jgi:hypothetical protein
MSTGKIDWLSSNRRGGRLLDDLDPMAYRTQQFATACKGLQIGKKKKKKLF